MVISIHQPNFIPWAGYFHKIIHSDCFVLLDNVEFTKGGLTNRNKIKFSNGNVNWLTVPVNLSKGSKQKINQIEINNDFNWQKKHLNTLVVNYSKSKYFNHYYEKIQNVYESKYITIADFNTKLLKLVLKELNIQTSIYIASEITSIENLKSNEMLVQICKTLKAKKYMSGSGARKYNDETLFKANGIELTYQEFNHPVYSQLYSDFVPNLSIIDILFNCGPESREIIG